MTYSNTPPKACNQSNYTSSCRLKLNGSAQEQGFIENLIVESIDIYGQDMYYVPRTLVNQDTILNEETISRYLSNYLIRAYVNNIEGWEGQGELLTKFGIRIEDKTTFIVSRKAFREKVDGTPEVGFQVTNLMNYQGQATVGLNTVSVGLGNPAWGPAIQANPSNYEIVFNGGLIATIASATGTASPGAQWTFTGTWPANSTGAPLTIRSKDYQAAFVGATLNVEGRPNEGDLIWFPATRHLFEIKFVEAERPFYQLGKGYVWELQCELYEFSDADEFSTGNIDIDAIENAFANSIKLVMNTGGTGNFTVGETVLGTGHDASVAYTHQDWTLGFTIWDGGEGYDPNDPPSITFSAPPSGGTQATGTVQVNSSGIVTGVTLNPGSGYTSAPSFVLEPSPLAVRAEVKSWNPTTRALEIINRSGTFEIGETIKGQSSSAAWNQQSFDTLNNTNSNYDMNRNYEAITHDIIDFSEGNPFGTVGQSPTVSI